MKALLERPTKKAQIFAQNIIAELKKFIGVKRSRAQIYLSFKAKGKEESFEVPDAMLEHIQSLLNIIAEGYAVQITAVDSELSTQEAAEMLNVSRPFVIKLLEEGQIPFKKVGTHRRINLNDLQAYEKKQKTTQEKALAFLTKQGQELNLYTEP